MLLDNDMGHKLLKVARNAIDACLTNSDLRTKTIDEPLLNQKAGCFVTIHKDGQLRGCIGNFVSHQPLYLEVAQIAAAAATTDPRFYAMDQKISETIASIFQFSPHWLRSTIPC